MNMVLESNDCMLEKQTTIDLPRFGECTYSDSEIIVFPWGLPGFAQLRRFLVISLPEKPDVVWMQSLDELKVALPLCDPWSLFADYEAPMPQYARRSLEIETPDSFCVMCVLVGGAETTINLLAPIIINLEARIGRQITLENGLYSVRTPVPRERPNAKEVASN